MIKNIYKICVLNKDLLGAGLKCSQINLTSNLHRIRIAILSIVLNTHNTQHKLFQIIWNREISTKLDIVNKMRSGTN